MRLVKSWLTVIGYPKLARANASAALALYIQTRRPPENRRHPRLDVGLAPSSTGPVMVYRRHYQDLGATGRTVEA